MSDGTITLYYCPTHGLMEIGLTVGHAECCPRLDCTGRLEGPITLWTPERQEAIKDAGSELETACGEIGIYSDESEAARKHWRELVGEDG